MELVHNIVLRQIVSFNMDLPVMPTQCQREPRQAALLGQRSDQCLMAAQTLVVFKIAPSMVKWPSHSMMGHICTPKIFSIFWTDIMLKRHFSSLATIWARAKSTTAQLGIPNLFSACTNQATKSPVIHGHIKILLL